MLTCQCIFTNDPVQAAQHFDFAIIGGGIFGAYAALSLQKRGHRCALIEQDKQLFGKASVVNQARLHSGYHYPRSYETAAQAYHHRARFVTEHVNFISGRFDQFYGVDRYQSLVDAAQYENFCQRVGLHVDRHDAHPLFNFDRIEALYRTDEWSFDPYLIAEYYRAALADAGVAVMTSTQVLEASPMNNNWQLTLQLPCGGRQNWSAAGVINATYASLNAVQELFGLPQFHLNYELCEMVIVNAPPLARTGLTMMDGPFCSVMPFGLSGQLSISSVTYTPHMLSAGNKPQFPCQTLRADCTPDRLRICNHCEFAPHSQWRQMFAQAQQYLANDIKLQYQLSHFTVKAKLQSTALSDGRPTVIKRIQEKPAFYALFGGKISSIYEIDSEMQHV